MTEKFLYQVFPKSVESLIYDIEAGENAVVFLFSYVLRYNYIEA